MEEKKKSPLKELPLRLPGQSVDEQIHNKWDDFNAYYFGAVLALLLAGLEWCRALKNIPPHQWIYSFVAAGFIAFCIIKFWLLKSEMRWLKQGRDGERIVAEHLEKLREQGYRVLHDVVGSDFNVDHVLIGSAGIFAIETKTWSKPKRNSKPIRFDGSSLWIEERKIDSGSLNQAMANARWLKEILKRSTSKSFPVFPVLVFPGWFIEQQAKEPDVFVLNPKMMEAHLGNRASLLNAEEISMASFHLEQFVRNRHLQT